MEVKYIDDLWYIVDDDGRIIEELGGFIDFISPLIIIGEMMENE